MIIITFSVTLTLSIIQNYSYEAMSRNLLISALVAYTVVSKATANWFDESKFRQATLAKENESCLENDGVKRYCERQDLVCSENSHMCEARKNWGIPLKDISHSTGPYQSCSIDSLSTKLPTICLSEFGCACEDLEATRCSCKPSNAALRAPKCVDGRPCDPDYYCAYSLADDRKLARSCQKKIYNHVGDNFEACYSNSTCNSGLTCLPLNNFYKYCSLIPSA